MDARKLHPMHSRMGSQGSISQLKPPINAAAAKTSIDQDNAGRTSGLKKTDVFDDLMGTKKKA
jgi:hypothetical protein